MTQITLSDRIQGALWGLLIGDALGVPYEFNAPECIPPAEAIDFDPPAGFDRSHAGVPPGTWSDDGAHALCLLASLLDCNDVNPDDLMRRLSDWYDEGYLAVDGKVFDVGLQTSAALANFRRGVPALDAGPSESRSNGNGSLMRVLPLALWHQGSDAALVADAQLQSRVTHGHLRSQLCCALYCLWARNILRQETDPWGRAVSTLRAMVGEGSPEQAELEFHIRPDDEPLGRGEGYVVDCLRSARTVADAADFETVVRRAVQLGNDTDTTACVAGGIAGIKFGIQGIPQRWRDQLRGQVLFLPLLERLLLRY